MSLFTTHRLVWFSLALAAGLLLLALIQAQWGHWLTFEYLKASADALAAFEREHPWITAWVFFGLYVLATGLSIPGAVVLTMAAGALFGLVLGVVLVSFASSLGALIAFGLSRYLLRDMIRRRFAARLTPLDEGIERDGVFYLLGLRLVPVVPFWLVNLALGLTRLRTWDYYWVSQVGMLPATVLYVNAGTQLAAIESPGQVWSAPVLASLVLLAVFPLVIRIVWRRWAERRLTRSWPRPRSFDRNVVVIGAGAGGLVSAYIAAALKARVTLIEAGEMGGDCLNTGCVPSKALIRSARAAHEVRQAGAFGVQAESVEVDFQAVMRRVRSVIRQIAPNDSEKRYAGLGVDVVKGRARITSPWTVDVECPDGTRRSLSTRNIVIAAGAHPFLPPIPGLAESACLTTDTIWNLETLPRRLLIIGGGAVGCELAQGFARLGSKVHLVEREARLLGREDPEASEQVTKALRADGVQVYPGHEIVQVERSGGETRLHLRGPDRETVLLGDELFCAAGRRARVSGYGLEALGVSIRSDGSIETDPFMRTNFPNIFAVGDVTGPFLFTHVAAHQAWHAVVNALFGGLYRFRIDYRSVPRATFTDPEVAQVGLTEVEARQQGIAFETTRYDLEGLDRAVVDGAASGFVKVLTEPGRDTILGVTIVGAHSSELIAEFALAMRHRLGLNKILATVHLYPSFSEANKYAAGQWRRAHAPTRLLRFLDGVHRWGRR